MKKSILSIIVLIGLMAFGAFGADLQDARYVNTNAITTNGITGTVDCLGEIKQLTIDVSTGQPVTIAITDASTGATVYSAATAADTTLVPRIAVTGSGGAALTYLSAAGVTNALYAPAYCMGLNVAVTSASNTSQTVAIKVLTDKNP